jgi:hypothetical protein
MEERVAHRCRRLTPQPLADFLDAQRIAAQAPQPRQCVIINPEWNRADPKARVALLCGKTSFNTEATETLRDLSGKS